MLEKAFRVCEGLNTSVNQLPPNFGTQSVFNRESFAYLVKDGLVEASILPLELMDFFIELGLYVGALELEPLQGINSSLYDLRQELEIRCSR